MVKVFKFWECIVRNSTEETEAIFTEYVNMFKKLKQSIRLSCLGTK